jgi:Tannase-like family of unknown function (DUF6351)
VTLLAACSSSSHKSESKNAASTNNGAVKVVSTRPDMVTGGNVLLQVDAPAGTQSLTVTANDQPLKVSAVKKWWLVDGLPDGASTLVVKNGANEIGRVDITNSPITGPIFSGRHMPLLACSTEADGLGKATDADCSAPTKVDYLSGDSNSIKEIPNKDAKPAGATLVVRRERGVINRSVYWIDMPDNWNGRLIYRFGGGCGQSYGQGGTLGTTADAPSFLAKGYATATATFNTFQTQCNDVLSAETALMVKEHFIEEFGVPVHTIGEGASGGAIQQHLILQNYPGILDGSVAILPFPDATSIAPGVSDCGLLNHYYESSAGAKLSDAQRAAINGHAVASTCNLWVSSFLEGIRPSDGCDPQIPKSKIYDAKTNPKGIRCDLVDANVNQLGTDPQTGFANRPLDNVGVQYGLNALNDKKISVDQFLDLNEAVGGFDVDGKIVGDREVATEDAIKIVYGKGRVSEGGGDQKVVPLIDLNIYDDYAGDIHDRFRAFSLRDRLQSPNQQIWTRGSAVTTTGQVIDNILSGGNGAGDSAVDVVNKWLDDGKMPPEAVDNCPGPDGKLIYGSDIYERPGPCRDNYPLHDDPRTAAGAARRNDILKCQLKDVSVADYKVTFSDAQQARLKQIFPQGVCDWSKQGVGVVPLEGTWLKY